MEELLTQYQKYITKVALKISEGNNIEDYIQEGNIGLINAYNTYDKSKGIFHRYALTKIKYAMLQFKNKDKLIKKPNNAIYKSHQNYNKENDINLNFIELDKHKDNQIEELDCNYDNEYILKCVHMLQKLNKEIISLYYYQGLTLEEIGKLRGTTKQNIKYHLNESIRKLKLIMNIK